MLYRINAQTHALYSELLERLLAESARRTPAKALGSFVTKEIKGETYVYFQYSEPGGKVRQRYVGKEGPVTERLIERFHAERPSEQKERGDIERLCAQLMAGGAVSMGSGPARVLKGFAAAGLFEAGAVLVGTHAFVVYGNMLGVKWRVGNTKSEDLDFAAMSLAAADESLDLDAGSTLERLEMGFLPVPALDPRHATASYKVRGQALRVDFLTPGRGERPVPVARLGTAAQPLPFLDYLLESPERAAIVDGGGFLALVPTPARFALQKVIVSTERGAAQEEKKRKDLAQAAELIELLAEDRPGDLRLALDAIEARGWSKRLRAGWEQLLKRFPALKLPA